MNRILEIKDKLERKELELQRSRILLRFYTDKIRIHTEELREERVYRFYSILLNWMRQTINRYTEELARYTKRIPILEREIQELNLELTSLVLLESKDTSFRI